MGRAKRKKKGENVMQGRWTSKSVVGECVSTRYEKTSSRGEMLECVKKIQDATIE